MRILPILPLLTTSLFGGEPAVTPRLLTQGVTLAGALRGGEAHRYTLNLKAGEYAKVVVLQKGVDAVVTALGPDGAQMAEVDSPNGTQGPEPVEILARAAGAYTVVVKSPEAQAPQGDYDIHIDTFMTAEAFKKDGIVQLSEAELTACSGAFEVAPGHVITTGVLDEIGTRLVFTDTRSGRVGVLHPHSPTEYFLGQTLLSATPREAQVRFLKGADGRISGLEVEDLAGKVIRARKVGPGRTEEVAFQSEGLTLKGALHLPPGPGPFPALVYAHGSGPATRNLGFYPAWFVQQGFAVLVFDKRGAGRSQGDWRTASFQSLAGDVLAGVATLKARPDIDAKHLGVFGISQGGWVGSLAASRSQDVKFFLAIVGSGVPVWENVAHECTSMMKSLPLTPAQLEAGNRFARQAFRMAADGAGPAELQAAAAAHKDQPWLQSIWLLGLPAESPWWTWWKLNGHVDPSAVLPKVACPVMWVLGDRDSQVPTAQSEPRIREALAKGGNRDLTLQVFPKAGHPMMLCETGLMSELHTLSRFVPGYFDAMAAWLRRQSAR